jgi:hypothetical protein
MRKDDTGPGGHRDENGPSAPARTAKKPYATPRLVTHGDLRKLALGSGGKRADGKGNPASKL